ncbi:hypothetical protein NSTCB13_07218 [Nostoc sp. DSM 114160]|jgi:hypothetical protein
MTDFTSNEFKIWVEGIIDDLNLNSVIYYSTESLKKHDYAKLWEIYKDTENDDDCADELAKSIISNAHGIDDSEFTQLELINHYNNSGKYDLE